MRRMLQVLPKWQKQFLDWSKRLLFSKKLLLNLLKVKQLSGILHPDASKDFHWFECVRKWWNCQKLSRKFHRIRVNLELRQGKWKQKWDQWLLYMSLSDRVQINRHTLMPQSKSRCLPSRKFQPKRYRNRIPVKNWAMRFRIRADKLKLLRLKRKYKN